MKDYRLLDRLREDLEKLHEEIHHQKIQEGQSIWQVCNEEQKLKLDDILWYMERIPMQIDG